MHIYLPLILVQGPAVLVGVLCLRRRRVPGQPQVLGEMLGLGSPGHVGGHGPGQDLLHHGQVLKVVVGLEQGVTLHAKGRRN